MNGRRRLVLIRFLAGGRLDGGRIVRSFHFHFRNSGVFVLVFWVFCFGTCTKGMPFSTKAGTRVLEFPKPPKIKKKSHKSPGAPRRPTTADYTPADSARPDRGPYVDRRPHTGNRLGVPTGLHGSRDWPRQWP
jgi:hypothetical protein